MGLIINGDTQFYTDGFEIAKADLAQVYLDLQWITPKGTDSMVEVRFDKFKATDMLEPVTALIDGIPKRNFKIDATSAIMEAGGLMGLDLGALHDLVITKMETDYPGFLGKIAKYDPFNP